MATLGTDSQDEVPASSPRSHQVTVEEEAEEITFAEVDNVGEVEIPTSSTPPFQARIVDEIEESSQWRQATVHRGTLTWILHRHILR